MKRAERTKLLIEVGREEALQMANEVCTQHEVIEIQAPREGLVMIKMRESAQQSLFYIGETLVTETKVKIGEAFGLGLVREYEPELSKALAIIDAAYNGQLPEVAAWEEIFTKLSQRLEQEQHEVKRSIERTKVQFDTMSI
ncbi:MULTISPECIES: phosphonate C-P lyase system protein PhnG [unclassified Lysinibacillus]|uniref:phosphonate C-P lyase system protein PhnG n=1 Tax=unclassified Lysinibacillus TaxID=2636778 RepID=UPI0036EDE266